MTGKKSLTIPRKGDRLTKEEIRQGIELAVHDVFVDENRPKTRADCSHGPRPCPWVGCQYHLYLDVTLSGGIVVNWPDRAPHEMPCSCALDEAERDGMTLEVLSTRLNLTRERVRQIEAAAFKKIRRSPLGSGVLEEFMEKSPDSWAHTPDDPDIL